MRDLDASEAVPHENFDLLGKEIDARVAQVLAENEEEIQSEVEKVSTPEIPREFTELFEAALHGELPRRRELKPWEPDKLSPRHLEMIMMRASGVAPGIIARFFDVDPSNVSIVVNHPDAKYLMARMLAGASNHVTDLQQKIELMGPLAIEAIEEVLITGKEQNKLKAAFGVLDRIPETANKREKEKTIARLEVSNEAAQILATALREGREIPQNHYAEFATDAEFSMVSGPGSGSSSESPTSASNSGQVVIGSSPPPATDSQTQEAA